MLREGGEGRAVVPDGRRAAGCGARLAGCSVRLAGRGVRLAGCGARLAGREKRPVEQTQDIAAEHGERPHVDVGVVRRDDAHRPAVGLAVPGLDEAHEVGRRGEGPALRVEHRAQHRPGILAGAERMLGPARRGDLGLVQPQGAVVTPREDRAQGAVAGDDLQPRRLELGRGRRPGESERQRHPRPRPVAGADMASLIERHRHLPDGIADRPEAQAVQSTGRQRHLGDGGEAHGVVV
ncbi:hypothetical protein DVJ78_12610 [Humibacter sp. BT305]|nr:hypothetical protein DVJ78_12610 [Humibacter sp. BT305]